LAIILNRIWREEVSPYIAKLKTVSSPKITKVQPLLLMSKLNQISLTFSVHQSHICNTAQTGHPHKLLPHVKHRHKHSNACPPCRSMIRLFGETATINFQRKMLHQGIKVKLPCLIKHHTMKTYWGVEV